jgi:type VI secretion system ImpM family protein
MSAKAVGCFGKLPFYGDFIRVHGDKSPIAAIERWYGGGAVEAGSTRARQFLASGPVFALVQDGGMWWGVALFPSQDQVGRPHPFAIFAGLDPEETGDEVGLLPLIFIPFFQRTGPAFAQAHAASGLPQVRELLAALPVPLALDKAEAQLVAGLETVKAGELWTGLFGGAQDPNQVLAERTMATLMAVSHDPAVVGLRIRPMVHQIHFCCLLMLYWLLRARVGMPALIALLPGSAKRQPAAVILAERPAGSAVFASLWPEVGVDESQAVAVATALGGIQDLVSGPQRSAPVTVDRSLIDPELPLRELLHGLASLGRTKRFTRKR